MSATLAANAFDPAMLDGLDEPVHRYFRHALAPGAPLDPRMRLTMTGRIDVGIWLPFRARWEGDARSFRWEALAGPARLPLLRVVDQFADGRGSMDVRLRPGVRLVHADAEDTARSAAGRAAAEAMWTPVALLPQFGVTWRAESDELIVARWDVPPERPELRLGVDRDGRVLTSSLMRWHGRPGYVPCGGTILEDRRFGDVTIPSRISIGWGYGTPRYEPFFEATLSDATPSTRGGPSDDDRH